MVTSLLGLLDRVRGGGPGAGEAARTLGLLLERESVRMPRDDVGIDEILDDDWRDRRLEPAEVEDLVDRLLDYVRETAVPHDGAVWALTKSYKPRIVPPLVALLRRTMSDPTRENLASLALTGVITASPGTRHRQEAIAAVREAANHGVGRAARAASAYLDR